MNVDKKKPRQRNRPRNKANRIRDTPETQQTSKDHHVEGAENDEGRSDGEIHSSIINESACKESAVQNALGTVNEQEMPSQTQSPQNDAMRLLQVMMRPPLLKEQQQQQRQQPEQHQQQIEEPNANKDANRQQKKVPQERHPRKCNTNVGNAPHLKHSKSKEKIDSSKLSEKDVFIANLEKKMESSIAKGSTDLPNSLLENLQKLLNQGPLDDVEMSDDDEEYMEYVYKPRKYFLYSLCNFCKCDLSSRDVFPCSRCSLTYYCSPEHMKCDMPHRQVCYALQQVADSCGGHVFYKCAEFSTEQFRSYRIVNIRRVESIINRPLTATEQEVLLFPRICSDVRCREFKFKSLTDCPKCGQVAYCRDKPEHLSGSHQSWCGAFQLFKQIIMLQEIQGQIEPSLPTKILKDLPSACSNTKQIFSKLVCDMRDPCEYATLSQLSTCPLTAWYGLKLCGHLKKSEIMTIHLIGAEIEFEVDVLHKWELFFLHITPFVKELHVIFVGPELNPGNISFEQLKKVSCCRSCRKLQRSINYHFESELYHDYCKSPNFKAPNIVCFFNAGLYRYNGYKMEDTWPETILAAANLKCPVIVTSYTEYEAPLDMARFMQESNRSLSIVLPPTVNPFASEKPERNFISDEVAPLMFKNYYCFLVE